MKLLLKKCFSKSITSFLITSVPRLSCFDLTLIIFNGLLINTTEIIFE